MKRPNKFIQLKYDFSEMELPDKNLQNNSEMLRLPKN